MEFNNTSGFLHLKQKKNAGPRTSGKQLRYLVALNILQGRSATESMQIDGFIQYTVTYWPVKNSSNNNNNNKKKKKKHL